MLRLWNLVLKEVKGHNKSYEEPLRSFSIAEPDHGHGIDYSTEAYESFEYI